MIGANNGTQCTSANTRNPVNDRRRKPHLVHLPQEGSLAVSESSLQRRLHALNFIEFCVNFVKFCSNYLQQMTTEIFRHLPASMPVYHSNTKCSRTEPLDAVPILTRSVAAYLRKSCSGTCIRCGAASSDIATYPPASLLCNQQRSSHCEGGDGCAGERPGLLSSMGPGLCQRLLPCAPSASLPSGPSVKHGGCNGCPMAGPSA
mmetsp:Transcript_106876/g.212222  ORF Transcript_106876/g.212222 Transcript_106876/m.212222 type:complete len:204 (-) Transcript_106876:68-679(-)